ncbi:hypothetical protein [Photorhabdus australis]
MLIFPTGSGVKSIYVIFNIC